MASGSWRPRFLHRLNETWRACRRLRRPPHQARISRSLRMAKHHLSSTSRIGSNGELADARGKLHLSNFLCARGPHRHGFADSYCPSTGRWYASAAIKTMLGTFLTKYDMKLVNPDAQRYFAWRTFIYPYSKTQVTLEPRAAAEKSAN